MSDVPRLVIRIKKGTDGRTALSCTRADGSTTWQRQQGAQAAFFPKHDLTHYAVESTFGLRRGFYGLVAEGWDFSDFGSPWPRGMIPPEANISELIVGFLDLERSAGGQQATADLNQAIAAFCAEKGIPPRMFTEEELEKVRQRGAELFARWNAVKLGEALEIPFDI